MFVHLATFILGLGALYLGADLMIRGASLPWPDDVMLPRSARF